MRGEWLHPLRERLALAVQTVASTPTAMHDYFVVTLENNPEKTVQAQKSYEEFQTHRNQQLVDLNVARLKGSDEKLEKLVRGLDSNLVESQNRLLGVYSELSERLGQLTEEEIVAYRAKTDQIVHSLIDEMLPINGRIEELLTGTEA